MAQSTLKLGLKFLIVLTILIVSCGKKEEATKNLADIIEEENIDVNTIDVHIDKSDYLLSIVADGKTLKQYPIVLGGNPTDDKRREGDGCTPEGVFRIRDKYPHKKWTKFIWIDYPNEESWKKHNAAKQDGEIAADATIGGEVGIHGVPEGCDYLIDKKTNWTLGCISMKNSDVNEIYPYITSKTTITIEK